MGLRTVYALNVLDEKRRQVVRPETFAQVPDNPFMRSFWPKTWTP